jgi:hypothetical protein
MTAARARTGLENEGRGDRVRRIVLSAGGVEATAHLEVDLAPRTAELLWRLLPLRATLRQSRWSGETTWVRLPEFVDESIPLENPATFMCPGTVHLTPSKGYLGLPYGQAQSRHEGENTWDNVVGLLDEGAEAFLEALRSIRSTGAVELTIRRKVQE